MSTTTERLPLAEARALAEDVVTLLAPSCTRIEIAGSIRRQKADIGDLEIVCMPKSERVNIGLFEEVYRDTNELDDFVACLLMDGTFSPRLDVNGHRAVGERYKRLSYRGFGLDLFAVLPPAQFGVILAIRTGPAEWSHRLVTTRQSGGWLPDWLKVKDGQLLHRLSGEVIPTPEETDFFAAMQWRYISPEQRA